MVFIGHDDKYTALIYTVGIPVGIAAKILLNNKIKSRGVLLPINHDIYLPILSELEKYGISFVEKEFKS
jgi:saccharopine dehydrogenase (NADP+, L-glutamate forming)